MPHNKDILGTAVSRGAAGGFIAWTLTNTLVMPWPIVGAAGGVLVGAGGFLALIARIDRQGGGSSEMTAKAEAAIASRTQSLNEDDCKHVVLRAIEVGSPFHAELGEETPITVESPSLRELLARRRMIHGCGIVMERHRVAPAAGDARERLLDGGLPVDGAWVIATQDDGHGDYVLLSSGEIAEIRDDIDEVPEIIATTVNRWLAEAVERDRLDG